MEIIGPAEIRDVGPDARYFARHFNAMMNAEMRRYNRCRKPCQLSKIRAAIRIEPVMTMLR